MVATVMDVLTEALPVVVGGLLGWLIASYFDRRSHERMQEQNDKLRRQVSVLHTTIYTFADRGDPHAARATTPAGDLAAALTARALETQDARGRVSRAELLTYFLERGHDAADVESAISSFCMTGAAREEDGWLLLMI